MVVMFWVLLAAAMAGGYLLGSGIERVRAARRGEDVLVGPARSTGVPSWHPEA